MEIHTGCEGFALGAEVITHSSCRLDELPKGSSALICTCCSSTFDQSRSPGPGPTRNASLRDRSVTVSREDPEPESDHPALEKRPLSDAKAREIFVLSPVFGNSALVCEPHIDDIVLFCEFRCTNPEKGNRERNRSNQPSAQTKLTWNTSS